jgi:hypothetical protein
MVLIRTPRFNIIVERNSGLQWMFWNRTFLLTFWRSSSSSTIRFSKSMFVFFEKLTQLKQKKLLMVIDILIFNLSILWLVVLIHAFKVALNVLIIVLNSVRYKNALLKPLSSEWSIVWFDIAKVISVQFESFWTVSAVVEAFHINSWWMIWNRALTPIVTRYVHLCIVTSKSCALCIVTSLTLSR